jgi:hypothetical protein
MPPFISDLLQPQAEPCLLEELDSGQQHSFAAGFSIGRDPACDLHLDHPKVSGHHAVVEWRQGAWQIKDLGSTNGTSLDSRRITGWVRLVEGQVVRFASSRTWRVRRLVDAVEGSPPTATPGEAPDDLRLELAWESEDRGVVRAQWAGATHQASLAKPFYLLLTLAGRPGEWFDNDELIIAVWGPTRHRLKNADTSLWQLGNELHKLFGSWQIPGRLIEKKHRKTRLALPSAQVRIRG